MSFNATFSETSQTFEANMGAVIIPAPQRYELLYDITTEEGETEILLNTFADGSPLKLRGLCIKRLFRASGTDYINSHDTLYFGDDESLLINVPSIIDRADSYATFKAFVEGGYWFFVTGGRNTNPDAMLTQSASWHIFEYDDSCTLTGIKMALENDTAFTTGCNFKVYGIRA